MAGVKKKPQLPKSVLDMKFMKKTKERLERELEDTQDHGSLYSNIITNAMRSASGNYVTEASFIFCENLMEGRLSFKGMNPEIERLMEQEKLKEIPSGEMQKDIPDDILAKKFQAFNKRKRDSSTPSKYTMVKKKKSH
ncbi:M-phase phosphoprotein 6 [Bombyx mandarina]|uniref:M-phase phosphoprotein 6 n=1 Tax=Bombyx mandarina TaxID=7092 RepID=A0A6J2KQS1_BOMMA|nr:M-phase phosphoprotein 6 [Bombyx mandarina]